MNTAWAKEKLEGSISAYGDYVASTPDPPGHLYDAVIRRTHTVIKIIETLGLEAPEASDVDDDYFLPRLYHVVTTALGLLDDWDELDKNLRPTAPAIAADQLHPWVWDAARTFWDSKHYRGGGAPSCLVSPSGPVAWWWRWCGRWWSCHCPLWMDERRSRCAIRRAEVVTNAAEAKTYMATADSSMG
jgi:hypothetical protein